MYVYVPSGKLLTKKEFDELCADYNRVGGLRASLLLVAATIAVSLLSGFARAPELMTYMLILLIWLFFAGRLLWVSFAPQRLLRERPTRASPSRAERRQLARSIMPWSMIVLVLVISGVVFLASAITWNNTIEASLWVLGSGAFFFGYLWIAILKIKDGKPVARRGS